jgi:hypothetical protein
MAEVLRQVVALLNRLAQLEHDAIDACRVAATRAVSPPERTRLGGALATHRRHLEDLASLVRSLGGEPAPHVGRVGTLPPASVREVLAAVHQRIASAYEEAVSQPGIPVDVLAALERALAEERALYAPWRRE